MKRKVIKQGHNTLTITLPAKWVEQNSIKAGDEVEISEKEKDIVISTKDTKKLSRIELDLSNMDFGGLRMKMRSAYKLGYDEIFLHFDNVLSTEFKTGDEKPVMYAIDQEINNLLGCEIIQQSRNSCLIKDFAFSSGQDMDNILRKVFLMMLDYADELIEEARRMNKPLLETMREKHFNISKFIYYYQRSLNKIGYKDSAKTSIIYMIVSCFDEIVDIEKYCAADIMKFKQKKLQEKTLELFKMITDEFRTFYEFFYKPEYSTMLRFGDNRWKIIYAIQELANKNFPRNELILLANMEHILELLLHLFEARMSLEH